VNDTYGHGAGDAVLVQLAKLLLHTVRASDVVVRWGGEEFLIVIRFVSRGLASGLAEKLRAAVAAYEFELPDGTILRRTCSLGAAAWPFSPTAIRAVGWERVVDVADAALYVAKHSGRDAWVTVAAGTGDAAAATEAFRADAAGAVARGEVVIDASARVFLETFPAQHVP
jgi:diguanylate cyclase (GGDEF)-like protein